MHIDEIIQQPGQMKRIEREANYSGLHVAVPGEIISFDESTMTAAIQPTLRKRNSRTDPAMLLDVPVFFPGGFVFDVNPGDECLVVFADACIDAWWQNGGISNPVAARMHDLSDGFAFVGFRSKARAAQTAKRAGSALFTLHVNASADSTVTVIHPMISACCRVLTRPFPYQWAVESGQITITNPSGSIPEMIVEMGEFLEAANPEQRGSET